MQVPPAKHFVLFLLFLSALASQAASRRATPTALTPPAERYRLDAEIDPALKGITGNGSVLLKNTTAAPLSLLVLRWPEGNENEVEFSVAGRNLPLKRASKELLEARLPVALAPGRKLKIDMRFHRRVKPAADGNRLIVTEWHPRLWWEGESHASYDVSIAAPNDVAVGASARLDPATRRYRADHLRAFGIFAARGLQTKQERAGDTTVRVVYPPSAQPRAELLLRTAVESVNFYRRRFGFYPQRSLTIVPGEAGVHGGYPIATGLVAIHGMDAKEAVSDSHWRLITAHEVAHQYWLEHVLAKETEQSYGWLMIGLGIWTDREFSRTHGLESKHPGRLQHYAASVRGGINTTIMLPPEQIKRLPFDYNSKVTHDKGFAVISALSAILGRDTFERVFQRALHEYAGRRLGGAEFRRIAEEESRQDLGWFFYPMLQTNQYAAYEVGTVTKAQEGAEHVARAQIRKVGTLRLPVLVEAQFENGQKQRQWTDRFADDQVLEFRSRVPLSALTLDPDRELPLVTPAPKSGEIEVATEIMSLQWTGEGAKAHKAYQRAVQLNAQEIDWFKLALTLFEGGYSREALNAFTRTAEQQRNENRYRYFAAIAWQGMMHDVLQEREQALPFYHQALAMDGELRMHHDHLNLQITRAFLEERLTTPFKWPR